MGPPDLRGVGMRKVWPLLPSTLDQEWGRGRQAVLGKRSTLGLPRALRPLPLFPGKHSFPS